MNLNILIHAMKSEGIDGQVIQSTLVKAVLLETEFRIRRQVTNLIEQAEFSDNMFETPYSATAQIRKTKVVRNGSMAMRVEE